MQCFFFLLNVLYPKKSAKVVSKKNLGQHLNDVFHDRDLMKKVSDPICIFLCYRATLLVSCSIVVKNMWLSLLAFVGNVFQLGEALDKFVTSQADGANTRNVLTVVPNSSLSEFWCPLHYFDYSADCKNGCALIGLQSFQSFQSVVLVGCRKFIELIICCILCCYFGWAEGL